MKQNLKPTTGVDSNAATRGSGKGVPGCNPFDTPHGVDKMAAPFKGKRGAKRGRSKRGY